jgi:two-component system cell cycle sensor histidine kinase/response regulator CckA
MLTNLIVNARDAISGHGNIRIDARMIEQSTQCAICMENAEGEFVEISVTDDGAGIEEDKIQKIFDAFFTTKEVGKGTGLGLLAVSNIIHNVGGHVTVESELGKGTVFKLLFPIFNENEYAQHAAAYLSTNKEFSELNEKSHTVLVIDDDKDNANLIKKWLVSNGQKCEVFFKSQDALLYFISHQKDFDAVITDNIMPNLTGVELSKVILGMCPTMPIIINSGTIDDIEKDDPLFGLENVHFLRKPIDFNQVAKILVDIEK